MKNTFLLFLFIHLFISCSDMVDDPTPVQEENPELQVEKRLIKITRYDEDTSTYDFSYTDALVTQIDLKVIGSDGSFFTDTRLYDYSTEGIVEWQLESLEYSYVRNGDRVVQYTISNSDTTYLNEFIGNKLTLSEYNGEVSFTSSYDENGNLEETRSSRYTFSKFTFSEDSNFFKGFPVQGSFGPARGASQNSFQAYNENLLTGWTQYDSSSVVNVRTYEYKYDDDGYPISLLINNSSTENISFDFVYEVFD